VTPAETLEPDVKITSLSILSPGRPDIFLPLPVEPNAKGVWFTLKEGSPYRLKFTFSVSNNIVSGLRYTNTVWKTGIKGKNIYYNTAKEPANFFRQMRSRRLFIISVHDDILIAT
jgi:hypothetical protein